MVEMTKQYFPLIPIQSMFLSTDERNDYQERSNTLFHFLLEEKQPNPSEKEEKERNKWKKWNTIKKKISFFFIFTFSFPRIIHTDMIIIMIHGTGAVSNDFS